MLMIRLSIRRTQNPQPRLRTQTLVLAVEPCGVYNPLVSSSTSLKPSSSDDDDDVVSNVTNCCVGELTLTEVAVLFDKDSVLVKLVVVVVDGCDGSCGGDVLFGSSGSEWKNELLVVVGDDDGDGGCGDDVTENNGWWIIL
ncbi:hypothetical protein Tco_0941796 [Tanacetum coccineum]|uniref:Uncharacterized protein n=1 Tax=Tanacetum coccineum TaxID=301880 RepID=A0ABQ5DRY0_9ASTR